MLLTPQHRRSSRVSRKALIQKSSPPADIYSECPVFKDYDYDKDMYLANDRYAAMIDEDIKSLKNPEDYGED